jgi:hydrogenase-4 component F
MGPSLHLLTLCVIPGFMLAMSAPFPGWVTHRKAMAFAMWLQNALAILVLMPVLQGSTRELAMWGDDLTVNRLGAYFIILTIFVGACAVTHADVYFSAELQHTHLEPSHIAMFYCATIAFLIFMCAVFMCNNLGLLWMAIEATTLSSAFLVYFDKTKNAIEATWKYLIICSVGIALALLGTVFIFASSQHGALAEGSLNLSQLLAYAPQLNYPLLRLGFIFILLGFGTKAGIFPLHSWLPDAHSEAPAPASAMLSGALLNCALYGIWRIANIMSASGHQIYITELAVIMGAVTVMAAALFLIRQHSFKRMWAYSSIENVGIMLIAIGLGSQALFFMQALNHSLVKVALFLLSGNIVQACGAKRLHQLHGIMKSSPLWGCLLTVGTFAVMGLPPFGSFVSEMLILSNSATSGRWILVTTLVCALGIAFVAVSTHVGRILFGGPKPNFAAFQPVRASVVPAILLVGSLFLGVIASPQIWTSLK